MNFKTSSDLRTSLISSYNSLLDLDFTDGTPERDMFVEAPIEGQLLDIWNALEYLYKLQAPFIYSDQLLTEDLDIFCRNNDVGTIPATYSVGELTFFTYNSPVNDVVIDDTKGGRTADGVKTYYVDGYYTIPSADASAYYNATTRRYEITVNVVAATAGTAGATGAQTVTELLGAITGIEGCINSAPITGGQDVGTLTDRLNQVKQKFKGRNLNSLEGIRLYVENYSKPANIVGSNDPLMLRTSGYGGSIDIYIRGQSLEGARETFVITSTGLGGNMEDIAYTSTGYIFTNQPVDSISLFIKNGTVVDLTYYELQKDDGLLRKSTRGYDELVLTSSGIANLGYFLPGQSFEVRYNYNKLLHDIEDDLNSTVNLYDNRDYLLREQEQVIIDIYMKLKLTTGTILADVISAGSTAIADYMTAFISGNVEFADIIALIKNINGVDNIDIPTATLTPIDGRTKTTSGDVPIYTNEYPITGTVTFVEWTY
jgi:hypothetical protein